MAGCVPELIDACAVCDAVATGPCGVCRRRAAQVASLVEGGAMTLAQAAGRLGVTVALAGELLAEEEDRRAVAAAEAPRVSNAALRRHVRARLAADPGFSLQALARASGHRSAADVGRLLGTVQTSERRFGGRVYPARRLELITPEAAGRLARGLGLRPLDADHPDPIVGALAA